jgi:hypothetical protein
MATVVDGYLISACSLENPGLPKKHLVRLGPERHKRLLLQFTPRDTFVSSSSLTCSSIYYVAVKTRKRLENKCVALLLLWSCPFILPLGRSHCVLVTLVILTATESWNSHVRSRNLALQDLIGEYLTSTKDDGKSMTTKISKCYQHTRNPTLG